MGSQDKVQSVLERIDAVTALQRRRSFILTGIYLAEEDLDAVRPHLQPDEPDTGAEGRIDNLPIHPYATFPGGVHSGEHLGISYTWVPMAAVD